MRLRLHLLVLCLIILFVVYNMASYQHRQTAVTLAHLLRNSAFWFVEETIDAHHLIMCHYSWMQNLARLIQ